MCQDAVKHEYTHKHTQMHHNKHARWHWLDILVIIAMCLEATSQGDIQGLATLRLLRVLRLAVFLRNVKPVHDAYRVSVCRVSTCPV